MKMAFGHTKILKENQKDWHSGFLYDFTVRLQINTFWGQVANTLGCLSKKTCLTVSWVKCSPLIEKVWITWSNLPGTLQKRYLDLNLQIILLKILICQVILHIKFSFKVQYLSSFLRYILSYEVFLLVFI